MKFISDIEKAIAQAELAAKIADEEAKKKYKSSLRKHFELIHNPSDDTIEVRVTYYPPPELFEHGDPCKAASTESLKFKSFELENRETIDTIVKHFNLNDEEKYQFVTRTFWRLLDNKRW